MLEEPDKIDIITTASDGSVELFITDAGITRDPKLRFAYLLQKLKAYISFVTDGDFSTEFPNKTSKDVRFVVMHRTPLTEEMRQLTRISKKDSPNEEFEIRFQHFAGADGVEAESSSTTATLNPSKRGKMVFYTGLTLAVVVFVAAIIGWINSGRSPIPGIIVAIIFFAFGFITSKLQMASTASNITPKKAPLDTQPNAGNEELFISESVQKGVELAFEIGDKWLEEQDRVLFLFYMENEQPIISPFKDCKSQDEALEAIRKWARNPNNKAPWFVEICTANLQGGNDLNALVAHCVERNQKQGFLLFKKLERTGGRLKSVGEIDYIKRIPNDFFDAGIGHLESTIFSIRKDNITEIPPDDDSRYMPKS